jgi:serine/threonine protein kinase
MPLPPGHKIGPYEILASIGAGGMGEVYRAKDTKLGRDVALKILPPEMAQDPDRLARFQREARAVAALNHPNVVTLHSVEESNGVHYLTMELVEGHSLDQIIPKDGFPPAAFSTSRKPWPTLSPLRTTKAWSIAISNPPTSWSPPTAAPLRPPRSRQHRRVISFR